MTMLPPEILLFDGNEPVTRLVGDTVSNHIQIELINQLFNRLQFYGTESFTYQDAVFVTNQLLKAGVRRVDVFLKKLATFREESSLVAELAERYEHNEATLDRIVEQVRQELRVIQKDTAEAEEGEKPTERYYLQDYVYDRLKTVDAVEILDHYAGLTAPVNQVQYVREKAGLSQFSRSIRALQLEKIRHTVFGESSRVSYADTMYPQWSFEAVEHITMEQAEENLAAAVLLRLAQNIWYESRTGYGSVSEWQNYSSVLYRGAEQILEEIHSSQKWYETKPGKQVWQSQLNRTFYREEELLLYYEETAYQQAEAGEETGGEREIVLALVKLQNMQRQMNELIHQSIMESGRWTEIQNRFGDTENVNIYLQHLEREAEWIDRVSEVWMEQKEKQHEEGSPTATAKMILEQAKQDVSPGESGGTQELYRKMQKEYIREKRIDSAQMQPVDEGAAETILREHLQDTAAAESRENQTEQEMAAWRLFLDQVNEKNLQMKQLVDDYRTEERSAGQVIVPDRKEIQKSALFFLEHPEEVMKDITERSGLPERGQNAFERILESTDRKRYEEYRRMKERLERVSESEPERQQEMALMLHSVLEEAAGETQKQPQMPGTEEEQIRQEPFLKAERVYPEAEYPEPDRLSVKPESRGEERIFQSTKKYAENILSVLEKETNRQQLSSADIREDRIEEIYRTEAVKSILREQETRLEEEHRNQTDNTRRQTENRISQAYMLHKRQESIVEEELLEQLRQMKQRNVLETEQSSREQHRNEKSQTVIRKVSVQNEQNVQELYRNSLQSQINQITDQVYQKLEKRLSNERKRRGY